jgi:hypothetical protein
MRFHENDLIKILSTRCVPANVQEIRVFSASSQLSQRRSVPLKLGFSQELWRQRRARRAGVRTQGSTSMESASSL